MSRPHLRRPPRELLFDPAAAASFFWLGGVAGAAAMLLTSHWPRDAAVTTLIVMAVAVVIASGRIFAGHRLPEWTLQIDIALGTALVSVVLAVAPTGYNVSAVYYVWVALFVSLYFTPRQTIGQVLLVAIAYAWVLAVGPSVDRPIASWIVIVGTCATFAAITTTLVSVLRESAREDPLTGVANRRVWQDRLNDEFDRTRRTQTPLTVISMDIDDFKSVNDQRGHIAGDRTLVRFVEGWTARLRGSTDFVARMGGDEFAILVVDADEVQVQGLVERLAEVAPDGVTASMGVATWDGAESPQDLYRRADLAMFEMKARRRPGRRST